ncbi:Uncharacterized protein DAT39_017289 [Clarias magur]|uniref:Uncharacterized protein n=1 Tax=Clarias magur TaxID=1594786 RepID=A0A8J4TLN7_CLAMG|nr:Uncharacterized protein DAT39_017289 [Clarias magur]
MDCPEGLREPCQSHTRHSRGIVLVPEGKYEFSPLAVRAGCHGSAALGGERTHRERDGHFVPGRLYEEHCVDFPPYCTSHQQGTRQLFSSQLLSSFVTLYGVPMGFKPATHT